MVPTPGGSSTEVAINEPFLMKWILANGIGNAEQLLRRRKLPRPSSLHGPRHPFRPPENLRALPLGCGGSIPFAYLWNP